MRRTCFLNDASFEWLYPARIQQIDLNFTQVDLAAFVHFYFYNVFYENLETRYRADHQIEYSDSLHLYYSRTCIGT